VAGNPNCLKRLVGEFSRHPREAVRRAVSRNPVSDGRILRALETDTDVPVREGVALHPRTPVDVLSRLASDQAVGVRLGVARNPATPGDLLEKLAQDPDSRVRDALTDNPACPVPALASLLTDPYRTVRLKTLLHPSCSAAPVRETALRLCNSPAGKNIPAVLRDLAHHPGFPSYLKTMIACDLKRGLSC
jgi:hypothetical protein